MEPVSSEDFLRWTSGVGIGFDPRYPESQCLSLLPPSEHTRFWVLPPDPATWPHFTASLLNGLDEWDNGFLWPRCGSWPNPAKSRSLNEGVRDVLLHGAGVPAGWAGAVRFSRDDEEDVLVAVMYAFLAFGWCGDDDLFFVPDHGRQLLQTDHHDVILVECSSGERMQKLVADIAKAGYQLPTKLPDWTFKHPTWMAAPSGGSEHE